MTFEQKLVLQEVIEQFFRERMMVGNHYYRKCRQHAFLGNIGYIRSNLKKAGIDPHRLDAILPLIRD